MFLVCYRSNDWQNYRPNGKRYGSETCARTHLRIMELRIERRTKDIPLHVLFLDAVKHEFCKKYVSLS